jgi:hypothetical protein
LADFSEAKEYCLEDLKKGLHRLGDLGFCDSLDILFLAF